MSSLTPPFSGASSPDPQLLHPRVLAKISNMALMARQVVEGTLMGLHKSPTKGSSIEFAEHKPYTPGNEIRHIDWKVYGKSEKYYVKQYEEETNLRAFLLVDGSGSMGYAGEDRVTKLDYARMTAASLAYLLLGQGDAVGMATTGPGDAALLPPRAASSHLHLICDGLSKMKAGGDTAITPALDKIAENIHRRSMVIVMSDLLEDPDGIGRALRRLQGRRVDVVVFHVQDPDEIDFPFHDLAKFASMEGPTEVLADPRAIRNEYRRQMQAHVDQLTNLCRAAAIDYHRLTTDTPLDQALIRFLGWRERIS